MALGGVVYSWIFLRNLFKLQCTVVTPFWKVEMWVNVGCLLGLERESVLVGAAVCHEKSPLPEFELGSSDPQVDVLPIEQSCLWDNIFTIISFSIFTLFFKSLILRIDHTWEEVSFSIRQNMTHTVKKITYLWLNKCKKSNFLNHFFQLVEPDVPLNDVILEEENWKFLNLFKTQIHKSVLL